MFTGRLFQKKYSAVLLLVCAMARADIKTVPHVDAARYLGDWYQIAHIPQFFEGGTCACARQRLGLGAKHEITVYNSCNEHNAAGKLKDIRGTAINDEPATNSKFSVDFGLPWNGTYWIIGLEQNYNYAVVTDKDGRSLYILSRSPTLSDDLYREALATATQQGLDTARLEVTDQKDCVYPN